MLTKTKFKGFSDDTGRVSTKKHAPALWTDEEWAKVAVEVERLRGLRLPTPTASMPMVYMAAQRRVLPPNRWRTSASFYLTAFKQKVPELEKKALYYAKHGHHPVVEAPPVEPKPPKVKKPKAPKAPREKTLPKLKFPVFPKPKPAPVVKAEEPAKPVKPAKPPRPPKKLPQVFESADARLGRMLADMEQRLLLAIEQRVEQTINRLLGAAPQVPADSAPPTPPSEPPAPAGEPPQADPAPAPPTAPPALPVAPRKRSIDVVGASYNQPSFLMKRLKNAGLDGLVQIRYIERDRARKVTTFAPDVILLMNVGIAHDIRFRVEKLGARAHMVEGAVSNLFRSVQSLIAN